MKRNIGRGAVALICMIGSAVFSLVFGGLLSLLPSLHFWDCVKITFLWFAAPPAVAGLLLLVTKISDDYAYGYGAGLYYGPIGVVALTRWLEMDIGTETAFFFGAIITALICYIIYHKCGHGNEDDS